MTEHVFPCGQQPCTGFIPIAPSLGNQCETCKHVMEEIKALLAKCEVIKKRQHEQKMDDLCKQMGGMSVDRERRDRMELDDLMARIARLETRY